MKSKTIRFFVVLIMLVSFGAKLQAATDHELLTRVDAIASYFGTDFSAEYTIVQERPGQGFLPRLPAFSGATPVKPM